MSQAFIRCPKTEKFVYVGLNLEWPELESLELGEQTLTCPACGETHAWSKADVTLRSDGSG